MASSETERVERLAMRHVIAAATRELVRAGRLVNPAEFGAWAAVVRDAVEPPEPASARPRA